MARLLRRLGYRYIKGENRHYLADSVQNVAYRTTYLQRKVANRDRNNNPIKPEVYLDESYVNVNHVRGKSWLGSDRKRYAASGKGARICMIATGILYRQGNELRGHFVEQSFKDWVANRGRLPRTLHGPCLIYMDGAAYHKRNIMPAPTTRTKKAEIVQWLQHNGVPHNDKLYKTQLLDLVRAHKPPPFYMAVAIATMYGHCILYTPPYLPELQPIELIWGNMKGWIGRNPAKSIGELEEKVATSKQQIISKEWRNAYKEIQKEEDQYLRALESDDIECTDAGEREENSEASDSRDEGL
ncbi:hypothetical protein ON010_g18344 [Phytophthora cinnamomi]|nr:hypothetical protein ON010_g18344 [Phytophthora cinnamomi]